MKHLFLFLFDKGVSIKASGSKCCSTRPSVETSKRVTLHCIEGTKNSLRFSSGSLSRAVFLFFQMHCINKAVSLAQKCFKDCKVCWECFRNVEQCWLLSFAFQQSSRFWAPCRSLVEHTGPCNQCSKRMRSLSLWHTHTQQCNILMYAFLCGYSQNCSCNMMLLFSTCAPRLLLYASYDLLLHTGVGEQLCTVLWMIMKL